MVSGIEQCLFEVGKSKMPKYSVNDFDEELFRYLQWWDLMEGKGGEGNQLYIAFFFHEFVVFVKIFSLVIKKLEVIWLSVLTSMFSFIGLRLKSLPQALPKVDLHHVSSSGDATTF